MDDDLIMSKQSLLGWLEVVLSFLLMSLSYFEFCPIALIFQVNAVVIGLGAGLLPMFLHRCLPTLDIVVSFFWTLGS